MNIDVGTFVATGHLGLPPDYSVLSKRAHVRFGEKEFLPLGTDTSPAADFAFAVPTIPNTRILYTAAASKGTAISVVRTSSTDIVIPEAPTVTTPIDAATNVTHATSFAWQYATPSTFVLQTETTCGVDYRLVTTGTSVVIPDLSADGYTLPTGCTFSWYVSAYPGKSIDEAATLHATPGHEVDVETVAAQSSERTFTTAP